MSDINHNNFKINNRATFEDLGVDSKPFFTSVEIEQKKKNLNNEMAKIPDFVYRFISLTEDENLNNIKIKSLNDDMIWFSHTRKLNDPFEFLLSSINKDELVDKYRSWLISPNGEIKKEFINKHDEIEIEKTADNFISDWKKVKDRLYISCFTKNVAENPALWAHYANGSIGFCLKYKVTDKKYLHKVNYVNSRHKVYPFLFDKYIDEGGREAVKKYGEDYKGQAINWCFTSPSFIENYITKYEQWSYEKEYRLVVIDNIPETPEEIDGFALSSDKCGLELQSIIAGINCEPNRFKVNCINNKPINSDAYFNPRKILKEIADSKERVEFYICDISTSDYKFDIRKIN